MTFSPSPKFGRLHVALSDPFWVQSPDVHPTKFFLLLSRCDPPPSSSIVTASWSTNTTTKFVSLSTKSSLRLQTPAVHFVRSNTLFQLGTKPFLSFLFGCVVIHAAQPAGRCWRQIVHWAACIRQQGVWASFPPPSPSLPLPFESRPMAYYATWIRPGETITFMEAQLPNRSMTSSSVTS
jgi:hypothetical protein